ncbi:hypothetical protein BU23DRAFT_565682 [Bimuria novae-zelandiae CBS 107.79]|uniref:BTB domain-containing protein n=1 Tax=Bimuria novae-zelandiae CBS 107.79 TaxID=1447943 RepID=A0A6A5VIN4_9PLEO|nr:hypothetical protein BU23DRAFT_565682 [Bimuria novae-zelandiae CBS 107.79]
MAPSNAIAVRKRPTMPTPFHVNDVRVPTVNLEFLQSRTIEVVTQDTLRYTFYVALLAQRSTWLKENISCASKGPLKLDAAGAHVEIYLHFVLRGTLPVREVDPVEQFDLLLGFYCVATKVKDAEARRTAMHAMIALAREKTHKESPLPSAKAIKLVYKTVPETDRASLFLIQLVADRDDASWMKTNVARLPRKFLANLPLEKHSKNATIPMPSESVDRCDIRKFLDEEEQDKEEGQAKDETDDAGEAGEGGDDQ